MPRPRLQRRLCIQPQITYYKPRGVPLRRLQHISLTREEFEAVWLVDDKGYDQVHAARHMRTSQSTVQRLLSAARQKIVRALVNGWAIAIEPHD